MESTKQIQSHFCLKFFVFVCTLPLVLPWPNFIIIILKVLAIKLYKPSKQSSYDIDQI